MELQEIENLHSALTLLRAECRKFKKLSDKLRDLDKSKTSTGRIKSMSINLELCGEQTERLKQRFSILYRESTFDVAPEIDQHYRFKGKIFSK